VTGTVQGAEVLPADARRFMILLSNWDGFSLVDQSGEVFGTVDDYIINLCEAHIIYMVVTSNEGAEMLVPYEAVTVNDGSIDAEAAVINVNVAPEQLSGAPTLEARPDLTGTDWEADVRSYWEGVVNLSSLGTGCSVPAAGTPAADDQGGQGAVDVTKLVYASDLSGATLQDGNGNALGEIQDAVIEPESGQIFYLAARLPDTPGQGVVLVPVGAVNLADTAPSGTEEGEAAPVALVLLVDNEVLQNAPTLANLGDLTTNVNEEAHSYWSEYVQMGPGPTNESNTTP
jgi:sporulation protein YlmC with PRC-barrel domain